jgi:hypothetical protein
MFFMSLVHDHHVLSIIIYVNFHRWIENLIHLLRKWMQRFDDMSCDGCVSNHLAFRRSMILTSFKQLMSQLKSFKVSPTCTCMFFSGIVLSGTLKNISDTIGGV